MIIVDFHNHVIPCVDDGSDSLESSLAGLRKMREQGIGCVIATPHFRASILNNQAQFKARISEIDESWRLLIDAAKKMLPDLRLERGVELALDEPLAGSPDQRVRLAGSRFMLVEFPFFSVPPHSTRALANLLGMGITPIVAHPERYHDIGLNLRLLGEWKAHGAFLQLNAGSVVGTYGKEVEGVAWRILENGLVDFLSSDYHCRGECLTGAAAKRLSLRGANEQFHILSAFNGSRLLEGLDPTPVQPVLRKPGTWERLIRLLRS